MGSKVYSKCSPEHTMTMCMSGVCKCEEGSAEQIREQSEQLKQSNDNLTAGLEIIRELTARVQSIKECQPCDFDFLDERILSKAQKFLQEHSDNSERESKSK